MAKHCWHSPEPVESYSNGYETSTWVMCCWCGASGYQITRRIGLDRVDGHGPHHAELRTVTRVDIRRGNDQCAIDEGIDGCGGCQARRHFFLLPALTFESHNQPLEPDHQHSTSDKTCHYAGQFAQPLDLGDDIRGDRGQHGARSEMLDRAADLYTGIPEQGNHAAKDAGAARKQDIGKGFRKLIRQLERISGCSLNPH